MRTWILNRGDDRGIFCLVDGPEDNFAVVDLETAIGFEIPYECSVKCEHVQRG